MSFLFQKNILPCNCQLSSSPPPPSNRPQAQSLHQSNSSTEYTTVADMTLGDIDEPPENFSTRRNARKIHFAGFLLCVSLLFEVSGVVGGRVSQSRVLGYFLGPDDNDSSAALVQIEMKLMTAREMDSLDIAVNTHKEYIVFIDFYHVFVCV